ncbi:glycoside hydrolase family 115 protein [Saccharata proteae CBS 121410]|uniref:Glycoside hydrolase family 115 protein n=1 Tax=Saccharata proteae CBS 121410 TaxID=1314787 RepID=A0A9P4I0Y6_9PEZI|nr:glycoside hydrolase family 115 protein [Saccharata proteae CBS 121410]
MAQRVLDLFKYDHQLSVRYNQLLGGKPEHIMDQTHLGYEYCQQPMRQATPPLQYVQSLERDLAGDIGISIDGSYATVPVDAGSTFTPSARNPSSGQTQPSLTSSYHRRPAHSLQPATPQTRASTSRSTGLSAPGSTTTTINITSSTSYGTQYSFPSINLPQNHTSHPANSTTGSVESAGYISIKASHPTSIAPNHQFQLHPHHPTPLLHAHPLLQPHPRRHDPLPRHHHHPFHTFPFTTPTPTPTASITLIPPLPLHQPHAHALTLSTNPQPKKPTSPSPAPRCHSAGRRR